MVAAMTARAGTSQRSGKRGGSVRQLVSVTTVCRRPANHSSLFLTAAIFRCAIRKQQKPAAISGTRMILVSHHDPWPAIATATAVQQRPMAAVRQ